MTTYAKQTYSELCEFLDLLGNQYKSKIPTKLLELFETNRSNDYTPHINPNVPIKEQNLMSDTLALIALLNLKYWCTDTNEIERLKSVYNQNENLYKKELEEKVDINRIFNNRKNQQKYENTTSTDMVVYNHLPFYKRFFMKLKEIFKFK